MEHRIIPTQGIHNFRDFGGYASRFGGRVRGGLLFRSGQHINATADDLAHVSKLSLETIVDLRSDSERALYPCARADDHQADVLFTPGNSLGLSSHIDAAQGVRTADEAHRAMIALYKQMPFRPILTDSFRLYFERLSTRPGPSLVHCLAGKDRTGIAVALVQQQLGVHPDDIMADYLLTNSVGNADERIAAGAEAVRANFGQNMDDGAVRTLMSVHPAYLETAFSEIGDLDRYAAETLLLTPDRQEALRQTFLA